MPPRCRLIRAGTLWTCRRIGHVAHTRRSSWTSSLLGRRCGYEILFGPDVLSEDCRHPRRVYPRARSRSRFRRRHSRSRPSSHRSWNARADGKPCPRSRGRDDQRTKSRAASGILRINSTSPNSSIPGQNEISIVVGNLALNAMAGQSLPNYRLLISGYAERFQAQDMDDVQPMPSGLTGGLKLVSR